MNGVINECLESLYDYSPKCKVSIELIQRLAQQLKLETFIDKLGYTVETNTATGSTQDKTQRLSIAGSSILLDVDFIKDDIVVAVSMSLASNEVSSSNYIKSETVEQDVKHVVLDVSKSPLTFLKAEGETSIAALILLNNLKQERLNNFPVNLKYLANIDQLSSSSVNLFTYLEKVGLLLYGVSGYEGVSYSEGNFKNTEQFGGIESLGDGFFGENGKKEATTDSWLLNEGLSNSVGKVKLNNIELGQVGLFLDFWTDCRYINHELEIRNQPVIGNSYSILVSIDPIDKETKQKEYLETNKSQIWDIVDPNGLSQKYKFDIHETTSPENISSGSTISVNYNWAINLKLNNSVYVPIILLEYLNLFKYSTLETDPELDSKFKILETTEGLSHSIAVNTEVIPFTIAHEFSGQMVPLNSVVIHSLADIVQIIPILRNFIVLSNIYRTLFQHIEPTNEGKPLFRSRSRRGSKVVNGNVVFGEKEMTEEAKMKLRESLKLSYDVTDEELLGLNAISESATYSTIQPINKEEDLDQFMKGNDEADVDVEPFLKLQVDDIDLISKHKDVLMSLLGFIPQVGEIYLKFKISNGVFQTIDGADDMDVDGGSEVKEKKFIKALNLTEDLVRSFKHVYS